MMVLLLLIFLILLQLPILYFFPKPSILQPNTTYDVGIVLGCPTQEDGSISRMQKSRMDKAIQLYRTQAIRNILVSGAGVRNDYIEADVMAAYAIAQGIDVKHLFVEKKAMNTYDNLKHAKLMCDEHEFTSVVVISSCFHIRRSSFFVKKFFQHYVMCPTDEKEKSKHYVAEYVRMWNTLRIEWRIQHKRKDFS